MKRVIASFLGACCVLLTATAARAYNTGGIIVWPVPFYPGCGIVQVTDLQALALEAMGDPGGALFNKVKVKVYTQPLPSALESLS